MTIPHKGNPVHPHEGIIKNLSHHPFLNWGVVWKGFSGV